MKGLEISLLEFQDLSKFYVYSMLRICVLLDVSVELKVE